jgi:hypothetical protein
MRKAEQRWPALSNADVSASATTCSDSAELSTIIAFWPPVSATSTALSARSASVRLMSCATAVEPVNRTPAMRGSATSAAPTVFAASREQLQRGARHAGAMEQLHRRGRDQRRLLGRFGEHGVAGGKCGAHLADEDCQRKIPRRDARDRSQCPRVAEVPARLRGVIAAEVGSFAYLANRVAERLARFTRGQCDQRRALAFDEIGRALEARGALGSGNTGPGGDRGNRQVDRARHIHWRCFDNGADRVATVARIGDRHRAIRRCRRRIAQHRCCCELRGNAGKVGVECAQRGLVGEIDATRVRAVRIERDRQRDARMRRAGGYERLSDRIGDQLRNVHVRIDDAIHERSVGAILEQPAHEVGEQGLVRSDGRVDAACAVPFIGTHDLVIKALTHAVQALEFVIAARCLCVDRGDRECVVARELGIEGVRRREHRLRASHVSDVGVDLARKEWVSAKAVDLRALDLRCPSTRP